MHRLSFLSKIGPITLTEVDGAVTTLALQAGTTKSPTSVLKQCKKEIDEYLAGKRETFTVPIRTHGTPFDESVLKAMKVIRFGKTTSYKEIAKQIGKPTAYRAVANACGRNALPILIPCHRVVASNGLGGFNAGIEKKKKLLEIEGLRIS